MVNSYLSDSMDGGKGTDAFLAIPSGKFLLHLRSTGDSQTTTEALNEVTATFVRSNPLCACQRSDGGKFHAFERAFPIERAIHQADIAIGYPNGRPESLELLRVDYVVEPLKDNRFDGILLPDAGMLGSWRARRSGIAVPDVSSRSRRRTLGISGRAHRGKDLRLPEQVINDVRDRPNPASAPASQEPVLHELRHCAVSKDSSRMPFVKTLRPLSVVANLVANRGGKGDQRGRAGYSIQQLTDSAQPLPEFESLSPPITFLTASHAVSVALKSGDSQRSSFSSRLVPSRAVSLSGGTSRFWCIGGSRGGSCHLKEA